MQKIAHQQWNGYQHKSSDTTYETSMKLPSYLSKHLHTSIYLIEWTNVPKSHIDKKHWQTDRITISGIQREGVLHNLSNTQRQKHARDDFTAPTTIQPNSTRITWRMVGESWIPLVPIPHGISYHMRHYWRKIPAQNYARGQGYRNTLMLVNEIQGAFATKYLVLQLVCDDVHDIEALILLLSLISFCRIIS